MLGDDDDLLRRPPHASVQQQQPHELQLGRLLLFEPALELEAQYTQAQRRPRRPTAKQLAEANPQAEAELGAPGPEAGPTQAPNSVGTSFSRDKFQ